MQNLKGNSIRKDFNENGFYIFKNILCKEAIERVNFDIHHIVRQQLDIIKVSACGSLEHDIKTLFSKDRDKYLKVVSACCRLRSITQLFANDAIDQILNKLDMENAMVPTHPVFHIMSESLKIPNGYYGLKGHQDWPSMQGSLDSVIFWIPLVNITEDLNPVEVIPKSHRQGVFKTITGQNESVIVDEALDDNGYIPVIPNANDIVVFSSFLVHRSSLNSNGGVRLACSLRIENIDEETYVTRGYPTAYKRSVERASLGYTPTKNAVQKIYGSGV